MLFDSWGVQIGSHARRDLHLFAGGNNLNVIDIPGSERERCLRAWCTLDDPRVLALQKDYVRTVVETLNDCDNVLYEISNEAGGASHPWQEHPSSTRRGRPPPIRRYVTRSGKSSTMPSGSTGR